MGDVVKVYRDVNKLKIEVSKLIHSKENYDTVKLLEVSAQLDKYLHKTIKKGK